MADPVSHPVLLSNSSFPGVSHSAAFLRVHLLPLHGPLFAYVSHPLYHSHVVSLHCCPIFRLIFGMLCTFDSFSRCPQHLPTALPIPPCLPPRPPPCTTET